MQKDNIDNGPNPNVINIEAATLNNDNFRTTIWTGEYLQSTLMAIPIGEDIGLEIHEDHDQFLRVEQGEAKVMIGQSQADLMSWDAADGDACGTITGNFAYNGPPVVDAALRRLINREMIALLLSFVGDLLKFDCRLTLVADRFTQTG